MKFIQARLVIIPLLVLGLSGCKEDPQRHLKLGRWYAQKGLVEEAILEFREVTRLYPDDYRKLSRGNFQALAQAHYNLSLMYTKKGWWEYALEEAQICFQLQPTKDHFELVTLIKERANLEETDSGS